MQLTSTIFNTALVIGAPIKGSIDGYNTGGIVGFFQGLTLGSIIGTIGGALVAVGGALTGVWQITYGIVRTPAAIIATASGKDWDDDAQEWLVCSIHYKSMQCIVHNVIYCM